MPESSGERADADVDRETFEVGWLGYFATNAAGRRVRQRARGRACNPASGPRHS